MNLVRGKPATTNGANQPSARGRSSRMPNKRRTSHRRVRFMNRTSCRLYKKDLTDEEKRKVWYNAEEFQQIQKSTHSDLREVVSRHRQKMTMKYPAASSEHGLEELNVRGLEHHLQGGPVNLKRQRRRRFVQYVLHTNRYMRVTNPEELRSYAVSLSHEDQYRAQRMAAYDAYEAYKVHREANFYRPSPSAEPHINGNEAKMEVFQEFDNVPKPRIAARGRSDRSVVPPSA